MSHAAHSIKPAKESEHYTASDFRRIMGLLGFAVSYVKGVSMRPLIWQDEHYVVIAPLDGRPEIGDLLVFEQIRGEKTACIVHRLVAIDTRGVETIYVTRGDNCTVCERFRVEDIVGKVTEVFRNGGWKPWHAIPKKHFAMSDPCYRFYSALWMKSWQLRRRAYPLSHLLGRIKRKLT